MSESKMRVAVVGAGAAGSAAAYRLWQKLGHAVSITVYERKEHVGGRAWDLQFAGTRIEVGGTLLHSSGRYTMELMEFTGSQAGGSGLSIDGKNETYAFWTGKGFVVTTRTSLQSMAANILRYVGLGSARRVVSSATGMASKWERVYDLLGSGQTFTTPQALLEELGLREATQLSLASYLGKLGANRRMTHDIVEPIIHNMYNQGAEIGALAGLVGLAGAGLAGGYLFAIEDGNWTIYDKTLAKIGADLRLNTQVTAIEMLSGSSAHGEGDLNGDELGGAGETREGADAAGGVGAGGARTCCAVTTADGASEYYDAVILAAPLALADLELRANGAPLDATVYPYQEVQTTLVVGTLNPAFFGADPRKRLPSTVFTADSAGAPFKSIGVTGHSPTYDSRIYKIFSADHEMTDEELGRIFSTIHDVHRFVWRGAYPVISPDIDHLPFELAPGLFYACAFETAAGAIEVESVAGYNTANLLAQYLT
ncbi:MAG: FAD-dependent oxidoreductase [Coriobacteriales bacterium]|jgi:protoporphyrinogen oxidase|nr:FAD-dependent oxidoreductase [Coriobacteriales bacterium]